MNTSRTYVVYRYMADMASDIRYPSPKVKRWVRRDGTHPDRHVTVVGVDLKSDTVEYYWNNWVDLYSSDGKPPTIEIDTDEFFEWFRKHPDEKIT